MKNKFGKTTVYVGLLIVVLLTASIYVISNNNNVRLDVKNTYSEFRVYENGSWILAGEERTKLWDGSALMRASSRKVNSTIDLETNLTTIYRYAYFKNDIIVIDTYEFEGNEKSVELFPISHTIQVLNAISAQEELNKDTNFILEYEIQKLLYTRETVWNIESPQSFGHKMKVEWEDGNYYSRIYKYKDKDEGKITIKYRVNTSDYNKNVRLFDPPANINVALVSPADAAESGTNQIIFNCSANSTGGYGLLNISLWTNISGSWDITNTTSVPSPLRTNLVSYYKMDEGSGTVIDEKHLNNGTNTGASNTSGIINSAYLFAPNDNINIGNSASLNALRYDNNFSIAGWVKASGNGVIIAKDNAAAGGNQFIISIDSSTGQIRFTVGTTETITDAGPDIRDSTWHHFAGVHNLTGDLMYLDGVHIHTGVNGSDINSGTSVYIGARSTGTNFNIDATIDELGIWNRDLNLSEIVELNNSGVGLSYPFLSSATNYSFESNITITDTTLWSCQACIGDNSCDFAPTNYTVIYNPRASNIDFDALSYANNSWFSQDFVRIGANISDCSIFENVTYQLANTTFFNSTTFTSDCSTSSINFTNLAEDQYEYNITTCSIYDLCNSTETRLVRLDTTFPLIEYASDSQENESSANFTEQDWIFVNVSVDESNLANTTFRFWTSTNDSFNTTIFDGAGTNFSVNLTGLSTDMYFWNVTSCDLINNCNTTNQRHYGLEIVNLSLELNFSNMLAELGTSIQVNATNNLANIYVDVDHPDYGANYSSGMWATGFELIINWFRKLLFYGDVTYQELNYNAGFGTDENVTFNLSAHRYDEIVNVSVNISGTNTPNGVAFYKANSSEYDRVFYGNLTTGGYIQQDKLLDKSYTPNGYNTTQNISFDNAGEKYLYFLLDDAAKLISFLINFTSFEYGFSFSENYGTNDYTDLVLSTAQITGGVLMPKKSNPISFIYDTFDDSSINDTLWGHTADDSYNVPGGYAGFDYERTTVETSGEIRQVNELSSTGAPAEGSVSQNLEADFYPNITHFDLITIDEIQIGAYFYYEGYEVNEDEEGFNYGQCNSEHTFRLGNVEIWGALEEHCDSEEGGSCSEYGESSGLTFYLTKQVNSSWLVRINGTERTWSSGSDHECGDYNIYTYWNNGTKITTYQSCAMESTTVNNEFYIIPDNLINPPLYFYMKSRGKYYGGEGESYGCNDLTSKNYIQFVNDTRSSYSNSSYYSTSVHDSSASIKSAALNISGVDYGSDIYLYLSGDNGDNWQNVFDGQDSPILSPGEHMKYRIKFNLTEEGYLERAPFVLTSNLTTAQGNLSNLTFDFGNDGIIDYRINGTFGPSNGTVQINLTNSSLADSFTDTPTVGHTHAVPLVVYSDSAGLLSTNSIDLIYNPNPVVLDYEFIQDYLTSFGSGWTLIDMILEASGLNSIVNLTDLRFDYAGGNDTIEVLAHNEDYSQNVSRNITYYYSRWDYEWGPSGVEWIYFAPNKPTAQNVTPDGQTSSTPILNITNYGYGGLNATLSILQNVTLSCVNTTISLDNNKSNGWLITDNWINLTNLTYLETTDIYLWADYDCSYSTWHLFNPYYYFRQCCEDCICSEELV